MPEAVARSLAKLEAQPQVHHGMNGPSGFHVVGNLKTRDVIDRLPAIRLLILVTRGHRDQPMPLIASTVPRGLAGLEWVLFERNSTMAHIEEADRCRDMPKGFLARHDGL
jgi:L-proline amide hydrolase